MCIPGLWQDQDRMGKDMNEIKTYVFCEECVCSVHTWERYLFCEECVCSVHTWERYRWHADQGHHLTWGTRRS